MSWWRVSLLGSTLVLLCPIQWPVALSCCWDNLPASYTNVGCTVANVSRNPQEVTERLDALIHEIREKWHRPALEEASIHGDVVLVAHGHILRAFAQRWTGRDLDDSPAFLMEAGGVGTLRYVVSGCHATASPFAPSLLGL